MASSFSRTAMLWTFFPLALAASIAYFLGPHITPRSLQYSALSFFLRGKVSNPASSTYAQSVSSYWSMQESNLKPDCIITPANTRDVATAVKMLSFFGSRFAIRGGGHTPSAGSANIDGGVTIDMRAIRDITVNRDQTVVSVGAGAIWGDVYYQTDSLGIAVVGGRGSSIGVGGLTTGGGLSFFSGRKGFACDNVLNYEVVLASGQVVNANREENSDLWLALKGGSNNFGIVTRFDLKAFTQGDFWGGLIVYDSSTTSQLLSAFVGLDTTDFDEYAALMLAFYYSPAVGFINSANIEYTTPVANPPTFQAFTSIQPQYSSTMRISNLSDFTTEFISHQPNGKRQLYLTNTFKVSLSFLTSIRNRFGATVPSLSHITELQSSLVIQPIPPAMTSKAASLGGNMLGLDPSEGPLVLCLLIFTWDDAGHDPEITERGNSLNEWIIEQAKVESLWNDWLHLNYAASWQDPIRGYGAANLEKLKAASRKYDPTGLFQTGVPGGFKLFK